MLQNLVAEVNSALDRGFRVVVPDPVLYFEVLHLLFKFENEFELKLMVRVGNEGIIGKNIKKIRVKNRK